MKKFSAETRAKMSAAKAGWKPSQDMIDKARARWTGDGNPMRKPEIAKIAHAKRRGRKNSPEQLARMTAAKRAAVPPKLTFYDAEQIRYLATIAPHWFVAKVYGIGRQMVGMICAGQRYPRPTEIPT